MALPLVAQDAPSGAALALDPRVPIHTQLDDPDGGGYGTWAAGRGFKVAFERRGIALYPTLGQDSKGQAWRFRTDSIRVGKVLLVGRDSGVRRWSSPDRFEYRFGTGVTEAYDLLENGVEQTFTVVRKPAVVGDIEVRGTIDSPWRAAAMDSAHRVVSFGDGERVVVDFGRASVIDATGRTQAIDTSWDGERITMTVPAAFVATAAYPLVIDPLIGPRSVRSFGLSEARSVDVARDDDANAIWVAMTFAASGRDDDLLVYRFDDSFKNGVLVYSDITASWSTKFANVATVGGSRKSVTTFYRVFSSTQHSVRWHVHGLFDKTLRTAYGVMPGAVRSHDWRPDVGGSRSFATGNHALIAFQRDASGTKFKNISTSVAMYALVDVSKTGQGVVSTARRLRSAGYDQELPSVTPLAEGGSKSGWPVVWQSYGTVRRSARAWDAIVRRVSPANGGTLSSRLVYSRTSRSTAAHCLTPSIAGQSGRYTLVYAESPVSLVSGKTIFPQGHAIVAERLDWPATGTPRFAHPPVRRREAKDRRYKSGGCAFDSDSRSHWGTVFADTVKNVVMVDKLGYRGRVIVTYTASVATSRDPIVGGMTFDDDNDRFPFAFATYNSLTRGWNAYGTLLTYRSARAPIAYGTGCTSAVASWVGTSYRGDEFAAARLTRARASRLAVLLLSSRPATVSVAGLGMPGCYLNVDLTNSLSVPTFTNASGVAQVPLPLPEDFSGLNVFSQWYFVNQGANALGVSATRGLHVIVVD
jgi:hypothetical protein